MVVYSIVMRTTDKVDAVPRRLRALKFLKWLHSAADDPVPARAFWI